MTFFQSISFHWIFGLMSVSLSLFSVVEYLAFTGLPPFTTLTIVQLSFLHSIYYPSRLSESDFQSFPHCPVGSTHSITGNKCHSRVTPNGGSGISAIQDMTFLSQRRRRHIPRPLTQTILAFSRQIRFMKICTKN